MNDTNLPKPGVDYPGVCVVFFCHDGKGNFAMAKRSEQARDEKGKWDIGGGKLEFGKTREEALRDEVMEEYGVEPLETEFLGVRDAIREENGTRLHWVANDYKVLVDREKLRICEPHKFTELKWFRLDSLPSPDEMHSQLKHVFANYKQRLAS